MMTDWKDYVNAILMAYYPGMEGGTAIAKIIFGDVNPRQTALCGTLPGNRFTLGKLGYHRTVL